MCNFYAFKARDGQTYLLKVIATGQRHCPAMAQALASSIAERVKEQAPGILTFAYIDNFLLAGKARKLVDLATSVFLQICRDCNITVEVELPTCTRVTYLGVVYDLQHKYLRRLAGSGLSTSELSELACAEGIT